MTTDPFFNELLKRIISEGIKTKEGLHRAKIDLCGRHGLRQVPSDSEILSHASPELRERVKDLLRTKRTRSASGIAAVAVMTAPFACPHGKCLYCPGGPAVGTPQSYTGNEPAAMRAAQHDYDPFGQTSARLGQLEAMGHPIDKIELIILGGTFTNLRTDYREGFVHRCLDAMNGTTSENLQEAQTLNELAGSRCVGLTVETRPDCFSDEQVQHSMRLGVTRIEFGVQSISEDVLAHANRGHTTAHVREATARSKDAGLKVGYHMMPGLPGADFDGDLESFRAIFNDESFKPDMVKIYPTVVLKGTGLYDMWKKGEYTPLTTADAVRLIARVKSMVPPWVRIQRIQREIEVNSIEAGLDKGNLRDLARRELARAGEKCRCIRCREVGLTNRSMHSDDIMLRRIDYRASGGSETFLTLEHADGETLVGYLRLRSCTSGTFLRELKVFGEVVPFKEPPADKWQHQGLGRRLVAEAEKIASEELDADLLRVTSGVGARDYYRRLGYFLEEPYMVKAFPDH
jgi:elongator complex protein 3